MRCFQFLKSLIAKTLIGFVLLATPSVLTAQYGALGSDLGILSVPDYSMEGMIRLGYPEQPAAYPYKQRDPWYDRKPLAEMGSKELWAAAAREGVPLAESQDLVEAWQHLRDALLDYRAYNWGARPSLKEIPSALPPEYLHYLKGAWYFAGKADNSARREWLAVLALPQTQGTHLQLWATYMLGRSYVGSDAASARDWLGRVRQLVDAGLADEMDLAHESLGWEARTYLDEKDYAAAARLYLKQFDAGDYGGLISLQYLAYDIYALEEDDAFVTAIRDDLVCTVLLALATESRKTRLGERFLRLVESARQERRIGQERLAWLAFLTHNRRIADRNWDDKTWSAPEHDTPQDPAYWLNQVETLGPVGLWMRGKIALCEHRYAAAEKDILRALANCLPELTWGGDCDYRHWWYGGEVWATRRSWPRPLAEYIQGDLALAHYFQGDYPEALLAFARADLFIEAAWVAESMLSIDELKAFLDNPPADLEPYGLRYLLARRLIRSARAYEAAPYLPSSLRPLLDELIACIQIGDDTTRPAPERAEAYWRAARICRHRGMELMGTELWPDYRQLDGQNCPDIWSREGEGVAFPPTAREKARAEANFPDPAKRFHYRYIAHEFALAAVALMPDNHDETARRLTIAGSWVSARDPQAADIFYKELVRRCPETELGQAAKKKHWFPKLEVADLNDFPEVDYRH